jgi:hypothetical protein
VLEAGLIVIVVITVAEVTPAEFAAVMESVISVGDSTPVGAVKFTAAVVGPLDVKVRPVKAGVPDWVTLNVSGKCAGMFGSEPLIAKLPADPESTVSGAMGSMLGARAGLTVTVLVAVEDPALLVAVSERLTVVELPASGAV